MLILHHNANSWRRRRDPQQRLGLLLSAVSYFFALAALSSYEVQHENYLHSTFSWTGSFFSQPKVGLSVIQGVSDINVSTDVPGLCLYAAEQAD